ncbi:MAG: FCD domain-containing protein [Clostridiales bacterium]|nr:FCD domain-containing protein [Clostridiales bacterium]
MFREIKDERIADGVIKQIIENIQKGSLKPGDPLPSERAMAEAMGVSVSSLREVLRALELLGIIETVQSGNNYVTDDLGNWLEKPLTLLFDLNHGYVRQTQQLRAALERELAILAARKCTPLDAAELWMILDQMEMTEDSHKKVLLDQRLHRKIGEIAENPMINSILLAAENLIEKIMAGAREFSLRDPDSARMIEEEHHQLVVAIVSNNESEAERCMSAHMEAVEKLLGEMIAQKERK